MKARIVRIGNSQGVRIPKPLIEQAGLGEEVELVVKGATIVIKAVNGPRVGWARAFAEMAATDDDTMLDAQAGTRFDDEEWEW